MGRVGELLAGFTRSRQVFSGETFFCARSVEKKAKRALAVQAIYRSNITQVSSFSVLYMNSVLIYGDVCISISVKHSRITNTKTFRRLNMRNKFFGLLNLAQI